MEFIARQNVTPGVLDSWQDCDCSGFIPEGAVGVIVHAVNESFGTEDFGLRKKGSTDDRFGHGMGMVSHAWFAIGVDANRVFQAYVDDNDQTVWVVGYFMPADAYFFTNAVDKTPTVAASWETYDVSGDVQGGDTAIGVFLEVKGPNTRHFGARKKGSGDDRRERMDDMAGVTIGVNEDQQYEFHISNVAVGHSVFVVGYLKANVVLYTDALDRSLGGIGAYADLTALPTGAKGGIYEIFPSTGDTDMFALRVKGDADIYWNNLRHPWAMVECDGSQIVEGKIENVQIDFYEIGYFRDDPENGNGNGEVEEEAEVPGEVPAGSVRALGGHKVNPFGPIG